MQQIAEQTLIDVFLEAEKNWKKFTNQAFVGLKRNNPYVRRLILKQLLEFELPSYDRNIVKRVVALLIRVACVPRITKRTFTLLTDEIGFTEKEETKLEELSELECNADNEYVAKSFVLQEDEIFDQQHSRRMQIFERAEEYLAQSHLQFYDNFCHYVDYQIGINNNSLRRRAFEIVWLVVELINRQEGGASIEDQVKAIFANRGGQ